MRPAHDCDGSRTVASASGASCRLPKRGLGKPVGAAPARGAYAVGRKTPSHSSAAPLPDRRPIAAHTRRPHPARTTLPRTAKPPAPFAPSREIPQNSAMPQCHMNSSNYRKMHRTFYIQSAIIYFSSRARTRKDTAVQTIDLFCGCGELTAGFRAAGFNNLAGFDNWQAALDTYNENNSDLGEALDLSNLDESLKRLSEYKGIDGIIGGPPCQDFSSAGKRKEGDRADLTEKYAAIVSTIQPTFFLMENVPRADSSQAYGRAMETLEKAGYGISKRVIDASRVGVPQTRKRLITIGWRNANKHDEIGQLLDNGLSDHRTTMREYFGDDLHTDYIYRHPRSYARRAIFSIDEPCPTVRGVNRPIAPGYPGHHGDKADVSKARPLTTEERARVQTFEGWTWPKSKTDAEQIIGNAVPVLLAKYVACQIASYQASLASSDE